MVTKFTLKRPILMRKIFVAFSMFICLLAISLTGKSQTLTAHVKGQVTDEKGKPLELVNISLKGLAVGTSSDENGQFILQVPARKEETLYISRVGYQSLEMKILLAPGEEKTITPVLKLLPGKIDEVTVSEARRQKNGMSTLNPKLTTHIPEVSGGGVEALLKTMPGVYSNNELSSRYSVRGGNFDENLVYINGIEVYRPFLVRSGQQEGLSIINPDMVSSIEFSSGGFDASYGDKMSSVLDIHYRKPQQTAASAEISLLGASAHFEGTALKNRFTHTTGIRYKTNRYLLGTLDQKGDYSPNFLDFQTYLTYQFSPKLTLGFLGNIASNVYQFIPTTRETQYGTWSQVYQLKIYFDGQEKDRYETKLGALNLDYHPIDKLHLKLTASAFHSVEAERYDILGQYLLNEVDISPGSATYADSTMNIGIGSYLDHARNNLDARVMSVQHRGELREGNHKVDWGLQFRHETFDEKINEWQMRDSAGYSLPRNDQSVELYQSVNAKNSISSNRFYGFVQDTWTIPVAGGNVYLNGGIRAQYWNFNNQTIVSPRISATWYPNWQKNYVFRVAWGKYQQMPFFKELQTIDGQINQNVRAQDATHYVAGVDHLFRLWERPFKLSSELYYKSLRNLIPYQIDNIRIRYLSGEVAKGYAYGLDMKLNGEFVSGIQSWASLSLMKTEEDIIGDQHTITDANGNTQIVYPGYIPRPTDQRVNFSLFFQDYFPGYPSIKMYLTLHYGSKLPFGPPNNERWMATFRMPPYRRVDIGFTKTLFSGENRNIKNRLGVKNAFVSLEVFNLMDINNTISYFWVTDVYNQMHAVPNYLTGRRINLKLSASF